MKKKERIGFFGGTFDPIHLGHLNLAIAMQEAHKLDAVLFCPTSQSPHKQAAAPIADKTARRAMVAAAIAPLPQFTFLDLEIQNAGITYTVDSIRKLIEMQSEGAKEYFLILGADAISLFHQWKEVEQLIALAAPLVGKRGEEPVFPKEFPKKVASAIRKGMTETPIIEISSSNIRDRLAKGLYCGHLVPARVLEYIQQNQLYQKNEK